MIKIFGKYRYHWQPELSWLIIYWSLAITPIFIAGVLLFELYSVPSHILMLFTIFVALFGLGFHRYFIIEDYGILRIFLNRVRCRLVILKKWKLSKPACASFLKMERNVSFI